LNDAGETLGWLGDTRKLDTFVTIARGKYDLEQIGVRTVAEFDIGQYPVTNQWFLSFVKEGGYENRDLWTPHGKNWLKIRSPKQPANWAERRFRCPNQPVTGVSWFEAAAFCNWLTEKNDGYRYSLPAQEQWQAAAAGKDKRKYPWGPDWKEGVCNTDESKIGRPSPVGIFAEGRTPDTQVYDMAGNVWEWISTSHKSKKAVDDFLYNEDLKKQGAVGVPIIKGGAWTGPAAWAACSSRNFNNYPGFRPNSVGFRCARIEK
jgi:formylglycine-generating enzyme required for sulfatase activity